MSVPFTIDQFLGVFVAYNAAIWPAQIVAGVLGLLAIVALRLKHPLALRAIVSALALMWLLNGMIYHWLFFSAINPAAKLFAGFFVVQAMLLAGCATAPRDLSFRIGRDFRSVGGIALIIYAMLIYPTLGLLAGHGFMAGPMFGVAPCPTTIYTIGLLLLARGHWIVWLSVVPILWSVVGLAAALQLGMVEDFALPIAGLILLIALPSSLAFPPRERRSQPFQSNAGCKLRLR